MRENFRIDNLIHLFINQITAIISCDEAKDGFDLNSIAKNNQCNWKEILAIVNRKEQNSAETLFYQLESFPINRLECSNDCSNTIEIHHQEIKMIGDDIANRLFNNLFQG
jgi:hypothetical protein